MRFANSTFEDGTFILDDNVFERCRFIRCKLIFTAAAPAKLIECHFERCDWVFDGPAETALEFLSGMYRGLGDEGAALVEAVFDSIRRGSLGREITAHAARTAPTAAR